MGAYHFVLCLCVLASHPALAAPLTLETAVQRADVVSPDVVAAKQALNTSEAALGLAKVRPQNPLFQVEYLGPTHEPDGTPTGSFVNLLLYQSVEIAAKHRWRKGRASAELDRARWALARVRLASEVSVMRLYATALHLEALRKLADARVKDAEELAGVLHRRVEAGLYTAADEELARMDRMAGALTHEAAVQAAENARTELLRAVGLDGSEPATPAGTLEDFRGADLTLARKRVADLVWARPDLNWARADMLVAEQNLGFQRADRTPDLLVGPQFEHDPSGAETYGVKAAIELPILNPRRAASHLARVDRDGKQVSLAALERNAVLEATAALERYARARRIVNGVAQAGHSALARKTLNDQFQAGLIDVVRLHSAWDRELTYRRSYQDALFELAQAAAGVVQVTGLPRAAVLPGGQSR